MSLLSKAFTLNVRNKLPSYIKFKHQKESMFFNAKLINTDAKATDPEKYTPVYEFPYIKVMSTINRLKLYQTILTGVTTPLSFILSQINIINSNVAIFTCSCGIVGCLIFYTAGHFCNNFIGIIYVNQSENKAKLSYVQFWGKRKDTIIPFEDIISLSEIPFKLTDRFYLKFSRVSTKEILKLNIEKGKVLDESKFNKIFGGA